ncbi:hypothetical protein [Pendulispora albinea]|uniref:Uncharacterized protein n=1 Tax=Pendulispora albinea TaxID=2741071 RepID=A0ABZ2LZW7_9BACT
MIPKTRLPAKSEHFDDRPLDSLQGATNEARQVANQAPITSTIVGPITFTSGGQSIRLEHKLQRQPVEWTAIDTTRPPNSLGTYDGFGAFRRVAWDSLTITIASYFSCTATFRVA